VKTARGVLLHIAFSGLLLPASCGDRTDFDSGPDIQPILDSLEGLGLDTFLEEAYTQWLLRSPESVTSYGLDHLFGGPLTDLDNLYDGYIKRTQQLEVGLLELLDRYARDTMTAEQRLSVDILRWRLDDAVRGHRFLYHDYLVIPVVTSWHQNTMIFFRDLQPVRNKREAEAYVTRLEKVGRQYDELIDSLERRRKRHLILPRDLLAYTASEVRKVSNASPGHSVFYSTFLTKLDALGLPSATRDRLAKRAREAVEDSVLPAYERLADQLDAMLLGAPTRVGAWLLDQGDEYYAYALRHHTTTELDADTIHELGLQEVARLRSELADRFAQRGYPEESLAASFARVGSEGGSYSGSDILARYRQIIGTANERLDEAFSALPQAEVIVLPDPYGGFYINASLDGSRPGAFYAGTTGTVAAFGMPTLAYHEAVPGHHLQIALAQEQSDVPLFRRLLSFSAFAEGWALYAERLAWELGWYDEDAQGDIGRLQAEIFRAARLVVDTGMHAKRWTFSQAMSYLRDNTGFSQGEAESQIARYASWPGQATAYKIGMLRLLDLRRELQDTQGASFDLKAFHTAVLEHGSQPLEVLEERLLGD
jgi:uncharacterized protein (DUF885 family)